MVQVLFFAFLAAATLFMLAGSYAMAVMAYSLHRFEIKEKEKENVSRQVSD